MNEFVFFVENYFSLKQSFKLQNNKSFELSPKFIKIEFLLIQTTLTIL